MTMEEFTVFLKWLRELAAGSDAGLLPYIALYLLYKRVIVPLMQSVSAYTEMRRRQTVAVVRLARSISALDKAIQSLLTSGFKPSPPNT